MNSKHEPKHSVETRLFGSGNHTKYTCVVVASCVTIIINKKNCLQFSLNHTLLGSRFHNTNSIQSLFIYSISAFGFPYTQNMRWRFHILSHQTSIYSRASHPFRVNFIYIYLPIHIHISILSFVFVLSFCTQAYIHNVYTKQTKIINSIILLVKFS